MEDVGKLTTLGRYRLLRRVGRGGMGEVWLAEDPSLQRQVALKILPTRKRDDQEFLVRFEREARAAASLHHPHILPVHDYGQQQLPDDQTVTYLVMSYVSGGSVDDRLKSLSNGHGSLTQDEALGYLFQVGEAIDYAHAHGIIHRDIKPANMLLRDDNWLLLTDFGIARILTDADASTTGTYLGTPTYMSPEQAQGHAVPASDIYSLAIVAYQLFTGRVPFQAENPFALTFQHTFSPPPSPRVYNPSLSPEFETALLRGMAKDPAQRPFSATAYVTNLRQALELYPSNQPAPVQSTVSSVTPKPVTRLARRKMLMGVGFGAGVLLVGGGATAYLVNSLTHHGPITPLPTATSAHPATAAPSSGTPLVISSAFTKPVAYMAWSPVKPNLVTWSQDQKLVLWDVSSASQSSAPHQIVQKDMGSGLNNIALRWSPNGKMLALGNGGFDSKSSSYETLIYIDNLSGISPGIPETTITTSSITQGLAWTSNNYIVTLEGAFVGLNSEIHLTIWNIQRPAQKPFRTTINAELPSDFNATVNMATTSPNGSTLAIGTSTGMLLGRLTTTGQSPSWQQIANPISLDNNSVGEIAWSANGRYVAAVLFNPSANGIVGAWDSTQQYQPVLPSLGASSVPAQISHLAWSPTSKTPLLAFGGSDGNVYLWNVGSSTAPSRTLSGNIQGSITSLAWSYDGQWLAASYDDVSTTILLWRM